MKDQRIPFMRKTIDSLVESLEATLRVKRWTGAEEIPEPLKKSADRLVERLTAADRLTSNTFRGTPQDLARVETMGAAIKRLDAAYVAFRQAVERTPTAVEAAAIALTEEIDQVKASLGDGVAP
jgi:hypothetical protein